MVDNQIQSININFSYKYPFETDEDYQNCFLAVFGIKEFNETVITNKTKNLYEELKNDKEFTSLIENLAGQMLSNDIEIGLYILFSFDYLHHFLESLKNKIENKYNFRELLKINS